MLPSNAFVVPFAMWFNLALMTPYVPSPPARAPAPAAVYVSFDISGLFIESTLIFTLKF